MNSFLVDQMNLVISGGLPPFPQTKRPRQPPINISIIHWFTIWLFNIAMENGPFIDDFPIKTTIYRGFSMAMLNNQMVILLGVQLKDLACITPKNRCNSEGTYPKYLLTAVTVEKNSERTEHTVVMKYDRFIIYVCIHT